MKSGMALLIHSQTPTSAPLKSCIKRFFHAVRGSLNHCYALTTNVFFVKFRQYRRSVKQNFSHSLNNNCIEKLKCRNFVATQKIFTQMKSCCCMTWGYKSYGYTCIFLYSLFCFCSRRKNKDIGRKLNGTYFSCYIIHEKLLRNLWDALITIYFARLWRLRY